MGARGPKGGRTQGMDGRMREVQSRIDGRAHGESGEHYGMDVDGLAPGED